MKAALYARYSIEAQSADSIEDQFRVCERLAERHGFTVVERFSDAAISGGTAERPGYQSLLAAARTKQFKVIVAEDTSRVWRSLPEQWRAQWPSSSTVACTSSRRTSTPAARTSRSCCRCTALWLTCTATRSPTGRAAASRAARGPANRQAAGRMATSQPATPHQASARYMWSTRRSCAAYSAGSQVESPRGGLRRS